MSKGETNRATWVLYAGTSINIDNLSTLVPDQGPDNHIKPFTVDDWNAHQLQQQVAALKKQRAEDVTDQHDNKS